MVPLLANCRSEIIPEIRPHTAVTIQLSTPEKKNHITIFHNLFLVHHPNQPTLLYSILKFRNTMSKAEGYPFIGEPTGLNVIVVGAGLGGLACAIECRRKGHNVTVFENAPEIMRIGIISLSVLKANSR